MPNLEALRVALRPPGVPLPTPRDVLEAAHRVSDLVHAERYREARALAAAFRGTPAPSADRLALLRAVRHGAVLTDDAEQLERTATDIVSVLHRGGHREQAAATVTVLLERGAWHGRPASWTRDDSATSAASGGDRALGPRRGRRRGEQVTASPELLVVVRALEQTTLPGADGARGGTVDPRRAVARLRSALSALPAVRQQILGDPETALRLHLAQALEATGDPEGATTQALDVLDTIAQQEADTPQLRRDPQRTATAAHAVLARTLALTHPLEAAHHALEALGALAEVDDPPLRVGLITQLLQALMAAGATEQASFTSGRLASLQRTLQRETLRIGPLLAVAAQRMHAERYEAAWAPLERARRIAREHRDHRSALEASRLAASIHERTADHPAALTELRRLAHEARWLADDLATPAPERAEMVATQLSAHALALRRALDLGRTANVREAAAAIERRARPEGGRPLLPAEQLWDHRVDARVGLFIAIGEALRREEEGVDAAAYEQHRREAMQLIGQVPAGHDERALSWAAYVDDRHAQMLADRGETRSARRAARRARDGWARLGRDEDVERAEALLSRLGAD
nr:hypothetical protein [Brachybacterium fresconis]